MVPLRNDYKPRSATTCGLRIKGRQQNDGPTSFRILHPPGTMRQNTDEEHWNLRKGEKSWLFTFLLTNLARGTVAHGSGRLKGPDCACSLGQIRCIEFPQAALSAFAPHSCRFSTSRSGAR